MRKRGTDKSNAERETNWRREKAIKQTEQTDGAMYVCMHAIQTVLVGAEVNLCTVRFFGG
jgi:hypothetical protein